LIPVRQTSSLLAVVAKRVIPCLDVQDGQITRGVRFGKAEFVLG
jgi:hypothetical protein